MIMFLIRSLIFVASALLGLLVADWILEDFTIDWSDWWGFLLAGVIFAVLQSILTPWTAGVARRNAPALLGGIGIVSTLIALLVVVLLFNAMSITSLLAWILAPVIVWAVTALATLLLPMIFIKNRVEERRDQK